MTTHFRHAALFARVSLVAKNADGTKKIYGTMSMVTEPKVTVEVVLFDPDNTGRSNLRVSSVSVAANSAGDRWPGVE